MGAFSLKVRISFMGIIGLIVLSFSSTSSATVIVGCGDQIGPTETGILIKNLNCPDHDPAIKIIGPGKLKMLGKTLDCENVENVGILIEGKRANLFYGTVAQCSSGVVVSGDGYHTIAEITVKKSVNDGFLVLEGSNGNKFANNLSEQNGGEEGDDEGHGFDIQSNDNKFLYNTSKLNSLDGFHVNDGNRNKFDHNHAIENGEDGFDIDRGDPFIPNDENEYTNNRAYLNGDDGFDLDGNRNKYFKNTSERNGTDEEDDNHGFDIGGSDNEFANNISKHNYADGFQIEGPFLPLPDFSRRNSLIGNKVIKNGISGIELLEGATENTIAKNVALDHPSDDLVDQNEKCDENRWLKNKFRTRNKRCIR